MLRFYYHFAAMFGTIWFLMTFIAVVGQTSVNAGSFGLYGFPLISLLFALFMTYVEKNKSQVSTREPSLEKKLADVEEKLRQIKMDQQMKDSHKYYL
jgi:hypothetical protein